jgi:hypothetical protein
MGNHFYPRASKVILWPPEQLNRRTCVAIGQLTPEVHGLSQISLDAPTEQELCTKGAVKLIHLQYAELTLRHETATAELRSEKQQTDALKSRVASLETKLSVLQESIRNSEYPVIIERMIELVILALLTYAIDFLRSGDKIKFTIMIFLCVLLLAVIVIMHFVRKPRLQENR